MGVVVPMVEKVFKLKMIKYKITDRGPPIMI